MNGSFYFKGNLHSENKTRKTGALIEVNFILDSEHLLLAVLVLSVLADLRSEGTAGSNLMGEIHLSDPFANPAQKTV